MLEKTPKRFEFDKNFLAGTTDGIVIGKTNCDGTHLTILFKEGRATIHGTRIIAGQSTRQNLYRAEIGVFNRKSELFEQTLVKLTQMLSTKKLPKKIWTIPNDLLVPRIKKHTKKKIRWKTPPLKEWQKSTMLVDSSVFEKGENYLGSTIHGTLILRTRWGSFLIMNKKTIKTVGSAFKNNKFFTALATGRKLLNTKVNLNPISN